MRQLNRRNLPKYLSTHTRFLNKIRVLNKKAAIDVGCGDGIFLDYLEKQFGFKKVVGLDIDPQRCRTAKKLNPGIRIVEADAEKVPFADESFDFVFVNALLHHLENPYQVINELIRICRNNGLVIIVEPRRFHPAIFLLSVLKTEEVGQLKLDLKKFFQFLSRKKEVKKIQRFPVNSFIYPYQRFPHLILFNIISKLEDFFNHFLFTSHQAIVVKITK